MKADEVISLLGLVPHAREGGWFVETYRNPARVSVSGVRSQELSTAIYYLLTKDTVSSMHRLAADEVFHHYAGDPVELLLLHEDGDADVRWLGSGLCDGQRPQLVVPALTWQGSILPPKGRWALLGCTVSPAFHFDDYEQGDIDDLCTRWPQRAEDIRRRAPRPS